MTVCTDPYYGNAASRSSLKVIAIAAARAADKDPLSTP
jgi:hypothetical protein